MLSVVNSYCQLCLTHFPCLKPFCWVPSFSLENAEKTLQILSGRLTLSLIWLPQSRGLIPAESAAVQTLAVIGWAGEVAQFLSTANGDATEPVAHEDKSLNLVLFLLSFSPSVVICFQTGVVITQILQACVNPPHTTTLRSHRLVTDAYLGRLYFRILYAVFFSIFLSLFSVFSGAVWVVLWNGLHISAVQDLCWKR